MTKEDALQIQCMGWMFLQFPGVLCIHVPNGGSRNPIEAKKLKRMGVRAGIPDIFIPSIVLNSQNHQYIGFWCELKIKPNKVKKGSEQEKMIERLRELGYYVCVCYTFEEFQKEVRNYLQLTINR